VGIFALTGGDYKAGSSAGGGGGRIAVYYSSTGGFSGLETSTAQGGLTSGGRAGEGTVGFFQVSDRPNHLSDPTRQLQVFRLFRYEQQDGIASLGAITLHSADAAGARLEVAQGFDLSTLNDLTVGEVGAGNAVLTVAGGSTLNVGGAFRVSENSTVALQSLNRSGQVNGQWAGEGVRINAGDLLIGAGSVMTADWQGYFAGGSGQNGQGPGAGQLSGAWGGGGSHGGKGGLASGPTYGDVLRPLDLGSGGGGEGDYWHGGSGGAGGGAMRLQVTGTFTLDGRVSANGQDQQDPNWTGGGAGGSVFVTAGSFTGSGVMEADGGNAPNAGAGGGGLVLLNAGTIGGTAVISSDGGTGKYGGGGGKVSLCYWDSMTLPPEGLSVAGGAGTTQAGANGNTAIHSAPYLEIRGPGDPLLHDMETIQWHGLGFAPFQATVDLKAHGHAAYTIAQPAFTAESFAWDTTTVRDGVYDLRVAARDADGRLIVEETQTVLVNNAAVWHSEQISADETWAVDRVHIVESNTTIAQGVRVTVAPGAIIKFARSTTLTVADGGFLDALGTAESRIVFTSLQDDSADGDTNLDQDTSVPMPGDWVGVAVQGTGQFTTNEFVDLRYLATTHSGTIAGNQVWYGTVLHHVTDNVVIPDGMTLTINPGAVVKFDANKGITVQSGGALVAQGSFVQPITFTSIRDDSVAGDSNGDGDATTPAPGDWTWLFIDGGQATIDHAILSYGAGPTTAGDGFVIGAVRTQGSAVVSLSNSLIRDPFWGGVTAWGGGDVTVSNTVITGAERAVTSDGGSVRLTNCTLDDNWVGLWPHGGWLSMTNSIISNSGSAGVPNATTSVTWSNIWSPSGDSYQLGENHNVSVDPKYKDSVRGNYRLKYMSPMIDAADGTVAPATDFAGASRYNDPRTTDQGVAMPGGTVVPDMGAFEFVEIADSSIDLIVTSVVGPSEVVAGENATLTWTITNVGTAPAVGPWHDTVSLVRNPEVDPEAILAGEMLVGQGVLLGPGESYTATGEIRVPGSIVADHRWQVTTNTRGEIFEGLHNDNNITLSAAPVTLDLPELAVDGLALTRQFKSVGESHWFKFVPSMGTDVQVHVDRADQSGATELYVGLGYLPDRQHFDARHDQWHADDVTALVANAQHAIYYVTAYPASLSVAPASFSIAAVGLEFGVAVVAPTEVGAGRVTLELSGGHLAPDMTYRLVSPDGVTCTASEVFWTSTAKVYPTFDLSGFAEGSYDVEVVASGAVRTLVDSVTVVALRSPVCSAKILAPTDVRLAREFAISVEYANAGNVDLEAPLFRISATDNVQFRLAPPDPFKREISFLAMAQEGPAGILRPGAHYAQSAWALGPEDGEQWLSLSVIDASTATPIDWVQVEQDVKDPLADPEKWQNTWARFVADVGSTWGDYAVAMAEYATLASARGQRLNRSDDLLSFGIVETYRHVYCNVSGKLYLGDRTHPLADVAMQAYDAAQDPLTEPSLRVSGGRTLADGSFWIFQLQPGVYTFAVDGYLEQEPFQLVVGNDPLRNLEMFVAPGGSLTGMVRASTTGLPMAGVILSLLDPQGGAFHTTSEADGSYRFAGLPGETFTLRAGGGAHSEQTISGLVVAAEGTVRQDVSVDLVGSVAGVVRKAADGSPLTNAEVRVTAPSGQSWYATSGADGTYQVAQVPPGTYTMTVSLDDYVAAERAGVVVGAGQALAGIDWDLGAAAGLRVTVVDAASGLPIEQADVWIGYGTEALEGSVTDVDGIVEFHSLQPGTYRLAVVASEHRYQEQEVALSVGSVLPVNVILDAGGSIVGTVRDADGAPLGGMTVCVLSEDAEGASLLVTQADGTYALRGLSAGGYVVMLGGESRSGAYRQDVSLGEGHWTFQADFSLTRRSIFGQVLQADNATPVSGVSVVLVQAGTVLVYAETDSQGQYCFQDVLAGSYVVEANMAGSTFTAASVAIGTESDVAAPPILRGSLSLEVVVLRSDTLQPIPDATVALTRNGSVWLGAAEGETSGAGRFNATGLTAGTYTVAVAATGCAQAAEAVSVSSAGANQMQVLLPAGHAISGQVLAPDTGLPLAEAGVLVIDEAKNAVVGNTVADSAGRYRVEQLGPGTYTLVFFHEDYATVLVSGVVIVGADVERQAMVGIRSTSVGGTVVDEQGRPVPDATILVKDSAGRAVGWAWSAVDGTYQMTTLGAGSFTLSAFANHFQPSTGSTITLHAGQTVSGVSLVVTYVGVGQGQPPSPGNSLQALRGGWHVQWPDISSLFNPLGISGRLISAFVERYVGHTPKPNRFSNDSSSPPVYEAPKCQAAAELQSQILATYRSKEAAYEGWEQTFKGFKDAVTNSILALGLQTADLVASAVAAVIPESELMDAITATSVGANAVHFGTKVVQIYLDSRALVNAIKDLLQQPKFDVDTFMGLLDSFNSYCGDDLAGILSTFGKNAFLTLPGSKLGLVFKLLGAVSTVLSSKKILDGLVNEPAAMESLYLRRLAELHRLLKEYQQVNAYCEGSDVDTDREPKPQGGRWVAGKKVIVHSSKDPNEKTTAGFGDRGFFDADAAAIYTVYFENQPTATAPAQKVVVTDTLSDNLDWSTFELIEIAFSNVRVAVPDGLQAYATQVSVGTDPNPVKVDVALDSDSGVITWTMTTIDPITGQLTEDPISGFLPPNDATHRGEGHVAFTIRPKTGLLTGTQITNQASIVFDTNAPIDTNAVLNTIDAGLPTSQVNPLSTETVGTAFLVSWTGQDDASGSGIGFYDVYVSDNGSPYTLWQPGTPDTSATFTIGQHGHTYAFYSVATDNVGHREPAPAAADTQTTVVVNTWHNYANPCDVNGIEGVTAVDVLLIIDYINAHLGDPSLPAPPATPPPYYDVNNDQHITAEDVLYVIDYINSHLPPSGEGEASAPAHAPALDRVRAALPAPTAVPVINTGLLARPPSAASQDNAFTSGRVGRRESGVLFSPRDQPWAETDPRRGETGQSKRPAVPRRVAATDDLAVGLSPWEDVLPDIAEAVALGWERLSGKV
jgi:hypothetical protein